MVLRSFLDDPVPTIEMCLFLRYIVYMQTTPTCRICCAALASPASMRDIERYRGPEILLCRRWISPDQLALIISTTSARRMMIQVFASLRASFYSLPLAGRRVGVEYFAAPIRISWHHRASHHHPLVVCHNLGLVSSLLRTHHFRCASRFFLVSVPFLLIYFLTPLHPARGHLFR